MISCKFSISLIFATCVSPWLQWWVVSLWWWKLMTRWPGWWMVLLCPSHLGLRAPLPWWEDVAGTNPASVPLIFCWVVVWGCAPAPPSLRACWGQARSPTVSADTIPVLASSCFPKHSYTPTLRCTDVWISPTCSCAEQRNLCWVTAVLLDVTLSGDAKGSYRSTTMPT